MNFETWWKDYDNIQCDKDTCEDAFYAGQDYIKEDLQTLIVRYTQHSKLPKTDEFNRAWTGAFESVVEDLERLLK